MGKEVKIRGLHLDIARHFLPCKTIINIIHLMKQLNFNTLHLHLSDDQSFPVQSIKYPEIKFDRMLSIEDQEEISKACVEASINIIPEIDIPGHLMGFAHIFRGTKKEDKLGPVDSVHLDITAELPIVLNLFEEFAARFKSKWIHMGGDEADGYELFPELLEKVCKWAKEKSFKVVAWDEVGEYAEDNDLFNNTLIIQVWRGPIELINQKIPTIQSFGYYLDHLEDPFTYYKVSPKRVKQNIGCIACTWTEAIDEFNIWCTILPTLYLLSLRWNDFPTIRKHLPVELYQMCEKYGYPRGIKLEHDDSWKTRLPYWEMGKRLTTKMSLDGDTLSIPVFSKKLIKTLYILYSKCVLNQKIVEKDFEEALLFCQEGIKEDVSFLKKEETVWRSILRKMLLLKSDIEDDFKNGIFLILKQLLEPSI